jgi:hypothetical protein
VYLLSRSRIRYFAVVAVSCRSMTRFLAIWVVQAAVGCGVAPRMRRVACSMTVRTCSRVPVRVLVSKKSAARRAWAWLRRKVAQVRWSRWGAGWMPWVVRISQTGGGRDLDSQDGEFAVGSAVAPAGSVARKTQDEGSDAVDGGWSARSCGGRDLSVAAAQKVAVPAQDGVGRDDQGELSQRWSGELAEQGSEKCPVGQSEPRADSKGQCIT